MYKAGIAGASGYTGYELLKLIHRHPQLEVGWLTSESSAGGVYSDLYPVDWDYPSSRWKMAWPGWARWMWSFSVCPTPRRCRRSSPSTTLASWLST